MKTQFRGVIIGLSIFIVLFIIALFLPQVNLINNSFLNNISSLTVVSFLLLLGLMFLAGVLDGFNPCAFSTLLIWMGFIINNFGNQIDDQKGILQKQKTIQSFALFYSLGIFAIYFLIGMGFFLVGDIINPKYIPLVTRIAGLVIVILGLVTIRDSFSKRKNPIIKMPKILYPIVQKFSKPTTKIGSFISGIMIGLCTIPCSGAIYMAVIFILNSEPFAIKYPILFIYNIGFILPIAVLAITISNKQLLTYLSQDFLKTKLLIKRIIGIITVILGIVSIYLV
ncbi:MAG: cytochrome c biogenesis protein CcdA [Erysipelotrichaceae bacterium]|nr:cytochrome c biogenesis protein CcdA [Erysipelotrichaceae bacterium]MDP3305851.1 cytochrome c biogenesis protein CcdA [Erysipelotrichaceae bacterium]